MAQWGDGESYSDGVYGDNTYDSGSCNSCTSIACTSQHVKSYFVLSLLPLFSGAINSLSPYALDPSYLPKVPIGFIVMLGSNCFTHV